MSCTAPTCCRPPPCAAAALPMHRRCAAVALLLQKVPQPPPGALQPWCLQSTAAKPTLHPRSCKTPPSHRQGNSPGAGARSPTFLPISRGNPTSPLKCQVNSSATAPANALDVHPLNYFLVPNVRYAHHVCSTTQWCTWTLSEPRTQHSKASFLVVFQWLLRTLTWQTPEHQMNSLLVDFSLFTYLLY